MLPKEIATLRPGAKVIGIGNVDVRKIQTIKEAADRTVKNWEELITLLLVPLVISYLISTIYHQMLSNQLLILIYWVLLTLSKFVLKN